ncbi:MAG: hypothetical protein RR388_09350 [Rikenellaceae bacterium]
MRIILTITTLLLLACSPKRNDGFAQSTKGSGKYLKLNVYNRQLYNTIYIEQHSSHQFKEYAIESLKDGNWHKIYEGLNPQRVIVVRFKPRYFEHLRLHIKRSNTMPRIDEFSLYYNLSNTGLTSDSMIR